VADRDAQHLSVLRLMVQTNVPMGRMVSGYVRRQINAMPSRHFISDLNGQCVLFWGDWVIARFISPVIGESSNLCSNFTFHDSLLALRIRVTHQVTAVKVHRLRFA
jgi:hypothetical protein